MNAHDLLFLYEYNAWATDRILAQAARLTPAQWDEPDSYGHGSIHSTLVHMLSAEWLWRVRCQESVSPSGFLQPADFPDVAALRRRWQEEEALMRAYLGGLSDSALAGVVRYQRTSGEWKENVLWHVLVHVVNHGTEHRSVLAERLTGYGCSPGDLDVIRFTRSI